MASAADGDWDDSVATSISSPSPLSSGGDEFETALDIEGTLWSGTTATALFPLWWVVLIGILLAVFWIAITVLRRRMRVQRNKSGATVDHSTNLRLARERAFEASQAALELERSRKKQASIKVAADLRSKEICPQFPGAGQKTGTAIKEASDVPRVPAPEQPQYVPMTSLRPDGGYRATRQGRPD